jgi:hypothetical protein
MFLSACAGEKVTIMPIYTVHEPPLKAGQPAANPERLVFVRDGFSFWAFLLTPLWMLRHRLWLTFVGYAIVATALEGSLRAIGASTTVLVTAGASLSLLVGLEAATLRRFALARRRWRNVGIVLGDDLEAAERRFFDSWVGNAGVNGKPRRSSQPAATVPSLRASPASEVTGLFPQPGASR